MIKISDPEQYASKEALYIAVRDAEKRVIDDTLLSKLPDYPGDLIHHQEWKIRSAAFNRFLKTIKRQGKRLNILDVGCGNGWMSARLYAAGHTVTAVDLNMTELIQAERVFGTHQNLQWIYGDIIKHDIVNAPFDVVVFGASCQYFPDITALTDKVKGTLKENGSIHLLDSFFYADNQIKLARQRTMNYYSRIGFHEMSDHYFHHPSNVLTSLGYKKRYPLLWHPKHHPQWWVLQL